MPHKPTRRDALEKIAVASALTLIDPGLFLAQSPNLKLTPEQIMGPFYPVIKSLDRDADLTVVKGKRGKAQGQVIQLMGRVLNAKGEPVKGARLELWQANAQGRYMHPSDVNPAPLDPNFQGFSVQMTDAEGRYRFKTIKPGAYPINAMNLSEKRPPHIHFDITGANSRLVTQMYFPDDPLNDSDPLFRELGESKSAAIGKVLPPTRDVEPDSIIVMWDIVIG